MRTRSPALRWGAVIGWAACIFVASATPRPITPGWLDWLPYSDKWLHAGVYAVLCLLLCRAWNVATGLSRLELAAVVIGAALYGLTDEVHQIFVETRTFDVLDIAADAGGAGVAAAVWPWASRRWPGLGR